MADIDPGQVLRDARESVKHGNFAEALKKYVWFHEHSLDNGNFSFAGVRLAYALQEWADLGKEYPPAHAELMSTRDRETRALEEYEPVPKTFQDVARMNELLGEVESTCRLFRRFAAINPTFARKVLRTALPSLIQAGECSIARTVLDSPQSLLDEFIRDLNMTLKAAARRGASDNHLLENAAVSNYLKHVWQLYTVLVQVDEPSEARRMHDLAIEAVSSPELREKVRKQFKIP